MAAKPKSKVIAQILTDKATEVFDAMKSGKPLDEIGKAIGVFPYHIMGFYKASREHRELFREALEMNAAMLAEARPVKAKSKKANGEAWSVIVRSEESILELVAEGGTLTEIAKLLDVPRTRISTFFSTGSEELKAKYEAAKVEGGHALADRSLAVTQKPAFDLVDTKMAELQARQLAWLASKRNPLYGDKQQIDLNHKVAGTVSISINP